MGGMTIFYAFFTGTSTAQTILREDEDGTLPRLFTTPTSQATVLGGKFLAVGPDRGGADDRPVDPGTPDLRASSGAASCRWRW